MGDVLGFDSMKKSTSLCGGVDPIQSTGQRDSLLNEKKM